MNLMSFQRVGRASLARVVEHPLSKQEVTESQHYSFLNILVFEISFWLFFVFPLHCSRDSQMASLKAEASKNQIPFFTSFLLSSFFGISKRDSQIASLKAWMACLGTSDPKLANCRHGLLADHLVCVAGFKSKRRAHMRHYAISEIVRSCFSWNFAPHIQDEATSEETAASNE